MSSAAGDGQIDLVVFRAGAYPIGFEARCVRSSQGTASAGAPLAETVLDLPLAAPAVGLRQCLMLRLPEGERSLLVASPLELIRMPITAIQPLPPLLAARNYLPGLRALVLLPNRETMLLFDVGKLRFS
ncbi:hypothetical protein MASR1M60_08600 [Rhodocyclaceae bacterium]